MARHEQRVREHLHPCAAARRLSSPSGGPAARRIAVIGNGGGGKSTLCRSLAERLRLPLYEVDAVQWLPGWQRAPLESTSATLDAWADEAEWIIDGFGALPAIDRRLDRADLIVYVDYSLRQHLWWTAKRQIASWRRGRAWAGQRRPPPNVLMFRTILRVHRMRATYLELVTRPPRDRKLVHLRSPRQARAWLALQGASEPPANGSRRSTPS